MTGALNAHPLSETLGFGSSGLGNLYSVISDAEADAVLAECVNGGIRYFDTSPFYGFGLAELRLGRFLREQKRDSFILSSKVGRYMLPPRGQPLDKLHWAGPLELRPVFDYSYDGTIRSIEQSISRLGFEHIDILLIHDVDRWTHGNSFAAIFDTAMNGAYRALDELRRHGHVKAIGFGVNEADVAADFLRSGSFDCALLAGRYTLLDQSALDDVLPLAASQKVAVIAAGVYNSGILAQTPPYRRPTYDYAAAEPEIVARATRIAAICARHGVAPQAAAIRFPRMHPAIRTVVLGMNEPAQVKQALAWFEAPIPAALWAELKDQGLLRREAPTG